MLYSHSHPSHVKYFIHFHSFLDFVVCIVTTLIFPKNQRQCAGFSINVAILFLSFQVGHHHAQKIDRQSALQTAEKENTDRIPFTLTLPSQPCIKSIILSFKRDINTGNFMFRSSFQTNDQPGTFRCTRSRCKTCPFIHNVEKMSEPKRSIKITDHFTCTSANVISCINCTYRKKLYIG